MWAAFWMNFCWKVHEYSQQHRLTACLQNNFDHWFHKQHHMLCGIGNRGDLQKHLVMQHGSLVLKGKNRELPVGVRLHMLMNERVRHLFLFIIYDCMIRLLTSRKLTSICRSISTSSMAPYSLKRKTHHVTANFDTLKHSKEGLSYWQPKEIQPDI